MKRLLVAVVLVMGAAVMVPARAFAAEGPADGPVKLTDADLDDVTAGTGPPAFVLTAGYALPSIRNPPPANRNQIEPPQVFGTQATVQQLSLLSQPIQGG